MYDNYKNMKKDVKFSSDIKENNKKRILDILRFGKNTKKQIADKLNISIATASSLCNCLIKEGYLYSESTESSEGGRIPLSYKLKETAKYSVSLNLVERDIITVAIVNMKGDIVTQKHIPCTHCEDASSLIKFSCNEIDTMLMEWQIGHEDLMGIGIAVSGNEMKDDYIIRNCMANPLINNQCVRSIIEEHFSDVPVYIDNEANEAVLVLFREEQKVNPDIQDTVYLYIGDGVGVGIISNGRLIKGTHGIGGEINHIQIGKRGYECYCGQKNCVETEISVVGFQKKFFEDIDIYHLPNRYGWEIMENYVKSGDLVAMNLMEENGTLIGYTLSVLSQIFDSPTYWIGGFDEYIFNQLYPHIMKELNKRSVFKEVIQYQVKFDKGFHDIITRGCYELVFQNWMLSGGR